MNVYQLMPPKAQNECCARFRPHAAVGGCNHLPRNTGSSTDLEQQSTRAIEHLIDGSWVYHLLPVTVDDDRL